MKNIFCGSKCVEWLLNEFKMPNKEENKKLYFVTDIANELIERGFKIKVFCYKSNLYYDYKNRKLKIQEAINSINNFIKKNKIIEKPFCKEELYLELKNNYIILNVDSKIINGTKKNSGHYVILKETQDDRIILINPEKTKFTEKLYKAIDIIKMCENNGNWRIQIRRKK